MSEIVIGRNQAQNLMILDSLLVEALVHNETQKGNPPPPAFHEDRKSFTESLAQFLDSDAENHDMSPHLRYLSFLAQTVED